MPKTATAERPDRDRLTEFLRGRSMSPVACGVDAEGRLVVSTYPERAKAHNARRRPAVSACVLSDDWDGPYVQVSGRAEVLDLPDALEPLVEYYRCISGEHPDWDDYRAAMVRQGKCLIRVEIDDWGPIATGGFPPRLA
jgi:PPOX class probable F420-dependent enzyme